MPVHTGDDSEYQTVGSDATDFDQYREVELDDGSLVVYEDGNTNAWIQSTASARLDAMA